MTREEIIRQIVSRDVQNQGLSKEATLRDAKKLYISACEHFGTWDTALKYAGVNVPHVATEAAYSQERVLRRIRKLCLNGCELSAHGNARRDRRLYIAARQYFGTWRQALRAAGINTANAFPRSKPRQLDRQKIVEQLRQRKEAGLPLTWSQVCLDNRALASAAKHAFHGWRRALAAADLAPTERLADGGPRWNKQRVIEAIKSRQREGKCLTCTGTGKDDGALVSAARRYFGNWTKALTAAGVLPRKRNKGSGVAK